MGVWTRSYSSSEIPLSYNASRIAHIYVFHRFLKCKTAILRDHFGLSVSVSNSTTEPDFRFGYKKLDLNIMHLHSLGKEMGEQTHPCHKATQVPCKTIMYFHLKPGTTTSLKSNSAADFHHRGKKKVC